MKLRDQNNSYFNGFWALLNLFFKKDKNDEHSPLRVALSHMLQKKFVALGALEVRFCCVRHTEKNVIYIVGLYQWPGKAIGETLTLSKHLPIVGKYVVIFRASWYISF